MVVFVRVLFLGQIEIVSKLFILERKTWDHITVCKFVNLRELFAFNDESLCKLQNANEKEKKTLM